MAYVISDACACCGSCADQCPVGAISMGAEHYEIDADLCAECGACGKAGAAAVHPADSPGGPAGPANAAAAVPAAR